jgi:hypothetical protein
MSLINLPVKDIARLYAELVECYHGNNRYAGDEAELYGYRFHGQGPGHRPSDEEEKAACKAFKELLKWFTADYNPNVKIKIEGVPMSKWDFSTFFHRIHVKVIRK